MALRRGQVNDISVVCVCREVMK